VPGAIRSLGMPRLTAGSVPFGAANGVAAQDANFTYNSATARLKVGVTDKGGQVYNALAYGATPDGRLFADGAITTGTAALTSATAGFTAADVGKLCVVWGAGASGAHLVTTIAAVVSSTQATLAANAGTTVSGATFSYGTDSTAAIAAAVAAAGVNGGPVLLPPAAGAYCFNATVVITSYVSFNVAAGATLRWMGAVNGTMFSTPATATTVGAAVAGDPGATIDANGLCAYVFDLSSHQHCLFGSGLRLTGTYRTPVSATLFRIRANASGFSPDNGKRNVAFNTYGPFVAPSTVSYGIYLDGTDSNGIITLNNFYGIELSGVSVEGVHFDSWCDNNRFLGITRIELVANNAVGVVFNGNSAGQAYKTAVTTAGTSYTSAPTVAFWGGSPTAACAGFATISAGGVTAVYLTDPGAGHAASGQTGTGCTVNITVTAGVITAATLGASGGTVYPASTTVRLGVIQGTASGGEVDATTNSSGVVTSVALHAGLGGTGYVTANGVATRNTPVVTLTGGGGTGAVVVAYLGGPTVDVGVYEDIFDHLAVDTFAGATGRVAYKANKCKSCGFIAFHQDPAAEGGVGILNGADSFINQQWGVAGSSVPQFMYYNVRFSFGSKAGNDTVSAVTIGGFGSTDSTYILTGYDSFGRFVAGISDAGFINANKYDDNTGGVFVVQQVYLTSPTSGAVMGHYAYKCYNSALNPHTPAYLLGRIVDVTSTSMDSRLELGVMWAKAESGGNNQPNAHFYIEAGQAYWPGNIAAGITAQPSNTAVGVVPAYGLSTTGGSARVIAVLTPAAPSSATPSPTGAASFWWWVVAEDRNGYRTLPSAAKTIANAPATLGGGNQVTVGFTNVAGAEKFYVLRTTSSTAPTGTVSVLAGTVTVPRQSADNAALSFIDTTAAGSLASFTVPARNTTADATVDGNLVIGAMASAVSGCAFTATASASSTTTAETKSLIGTGVGGNTVPANYATAGKKVVLRAKGVLTTGATAGTVTFQVKLGATVVASTGAVAPTISQTNKYWEMECEITFRTIGTSGTVMVQGKVSLMNAATPAAMVTWPVRGNSADPPAVVTIDTTASQAIDFQSITSNALHTITCNAFDTCPVS
jgi:hypothetical protein